MVLLRANDIEPEPLLSPVSGAIIDIEDNDHCLQAYKEAEKLEQELRVFKAIIRDALWSRTVGGDNKTRHIQGREYSATLVEQDTTPNPTVLRQVIAHFPDAAKQVIVPSGYRLDKMQWKKMQNTSSQCEDFNAVKNMVIEAINSGTVSPPRVTKITPVSERTSR